MLMYLRAGREVFRTIGNRSPGFSRSCRTLREALIIFNRARRRRILQPILRFLTTFLRRWNLTRRIRSLFFLLSKI